MVIRKEKSSIIAMAISVIALQSNADSAKSATATSTLPHTLQQHAVLWQRTWYKVINF